MTDAQPRAPSMTLSALFYARRGFAVCPLFSVDARGLCECGRDDCASPGKHPRVKHGIHASTRDEETIRAWWGKWPTANIAIATGAPSGGAMVLDVDGEAGAATLAALLEEHGALSEGPETLTGKDGGRHIWLRAPEGVELRNTAGTRGKLGECLDFRADGGYVVAPPSLHASGRRYRWLDKRAPWEVEMPALPSWLIEKLRREELPEPAPTPANVGAPQGARVERYCQAALAGEVRDLAATASGGRNHRLNEAAFRLGQIMHLGLSEREISDALLEACERNGLLADDGKAQVLKTIASGVRGGVSKPRHPQIRGGDTDRELREYFRGEDGRSAAAEPTAGDGAPPPTDADAPGGAGGSGGEDPRPEIKIGVDEDRVVDEAIAALALEERNLYQRGNMLVHVVRDLAASSKKRSIVRQPNEPRIAICAQARLRELCAASATWLRYDARAGEDADPWTPAHPPLWAVQAAAARGEWLGVRHLEAIVEHPVLRPDGTLLERPGYDDATGLLLEPVGEVGRIPRKPTREQAREAIEALYEAVRDFPFQTPAHRSAWLAGCLTPFARYAFAGPAPLFLISANTRGAGKTLLADVVGVIARGRPMAKTPWVADDDELRKAITAIALEGVPSVLFDNVRHVLGSAVLDLVLTGTVWKQRLLGKNESSAALPLLTCWWATGNNVQLGADTARRTLNVRLWTEHERPEERDDFTFDAPLLVWTLRERPRLAAAALTVLRAYCVAGQPSQRLTPYGSFEGWSDLVRSAVVWAGEPDPCDTREALMRESDAEGGLLRDLLNGWERLFGDKAQTLRQALQSLDTMKGKDGEQVERYELLRGAFEALCGDRPVTTRRVGQRLAAYRGRVVNGRALDAQDDRGTMRWRLVRLGTQPATAQPGSEVPGQSASEVDSAGTAGTAGTLPVAEIPPKGQRELIATREVPAVPALPATDGDKSPQQDKIAGEDKADLDEEPLPSDEDFQDPEW